MNCSLCQKELENYLQGTLPEGTRILVEAHLKECNSCAENFELQTVLNQMVKEEKSLDSNPFLSTRVMAEIEKLEHQTSSVPSFVKVLRPAIIGVSIVAAVFFGIFAGNFYTSSQNQNSVPEELSLIDDASLEYVNSYTN